MDCLTDEEVQYELNLRSLYNVKDNKSYRKVKLKNALELERAMAEQPVYNAKVDFESDFSGAEIIFAIIQSMQDEEDGFGEDTIKALESHVVHLANRLKRMSPPSDHGQFNSMSEDLVRILGKIESYYASLPEERFTQLNQSVSNEPQPFEFISSRPPLREHVLPNTTNTNAASSANVFTTLPSNLNSSAMPFTAPTFTTINQVRTSTRQSDPNSRAIPTDHNQGFLANLEQNISNLLDWKLSQLLNSQSQGTPVRPNSDRRNWQDERELHSSTHFPQNHEIDQRNESAIKSNILKWKWLSVAYILLKIRNPLTSILSSKKLENDLFTMRFV